MKKGSMTIFATLTIMLVTGFLFAILEAARITELHKIAEMNTSSVMESLFAGYEVPLWERYHLLGWNAGGEQETSRIAEREMQLESWSEYNLDGFHMMRMEVPEVLLPEYCRMTDEGGRVYMEAVTSYMRNNFMLETAKELYSRYEALQAMESSDDYDQNSVEEAVKALEEAKEDAGKSEGEKVQEEVTAEQSISSEERRKVEKNLQQDPLETAQQAKKGVALSLVLGAGAEVSESGLDLSKTVSHRKCCEGTYEGTAEVGWEDRICLQQYATSYFSNYTTPLSGQHGLCYEQEYILCGKSTDRENLNEVTGKLLVIREIANMAYLLTDASKMGEAELIAVVLAGQTLNPAIIKIVKAGILAAWAFAESVLDVRALLQGEKIAVIKNAGQWTSDIYAMGSCLSGTMQAKPCSNGLSYGTYLGLLMFAPNAQIVACRAMDLQEAAIRKMEGYEDFQMDYMVVEASADITYRYESLFYPRESGTFMQKGSYAYGKAGV